MNNDHLVGDAKIPTDEDITRLAKKVEGEWSTLKYLESEDAAQHFWNDRSLATSSNGTTGKTTLKDYLLKFKGGTTLKLDIGGHAVIPGNEGERLGKILNARSSLGDAIEELQIAKEKKRVHDVVTSIEEDIQLYKKVDDCPICLEPLHSGLFKRLNFNVFFCCGKRTCDSCRDKHSKEISSKECPLCRHPFPMTMEQAIAKKEQLAKDGHPYMQYVLAKEHFLGQCPGGVNKSNDNKALQYFTKAANNNEVEAQAFLGVLYTQNPRNIVKTQSFVEAQRWYEKAFKNGHLLASATLSRMYIQGEGGMERNIPEAVRLATFAAHHGLIDAQCMLGQIHSNGTITIDENEIGPQYERAKYWYGRAIRHAEEGVIKENCPHAYAGYAEVLLFLAQQNSDGIIDVVGKSPAPEAIYWFQKAKELNSIQPKQLQLMQNLECMGKVTCLNCYVDVEAADCKLRPCSRCKWANYCGKECQIGHWKLGHKNDCKKSY